MTWGKKNRLNRIFNPKTRRTVMFAVDHPYFLGPITGLKNLQELLKKTAEHADAIMPAAEFAAWHAEKGYVLSPEVQKPIVLRVSGGSSIERGVYADEDLTITLEQALRLNASAVAISIFVGTEHERRSITNLAKLSSKAHRFGMPIVAVTAVGSALDSKGSGIGKNCKYLKLASRMAQANGADLVKTYYFDEDKDGKFSDLIDSMHVPVVVAGGRRPKDLTKKTAEEYALEMTEKAIKAGASGVDMGRNIFQSSNPVAMIKAIRAVVHENKSAGKAYEQFKKESKT